MSEIKIITHTHEHIHASHGHKHDDHTYGFKDRHRHEHEHQVIIYGDERGYQIVGESLVGTHILVEEEENV